jgi:hypothetical protein
MTLDELAGEEAALMAEVDSVAGTIEGRHDELARRGVFAAYSRTHARYAALAEAGDAEALKRALFLQWYCLSEAGAFTGLGEIAPAAAECVLDTLERLAAHDAVDNELQWMLGHYYAVTPFAFEGRPGLRRWLDTSAPESADAASFQGRGQMGLYWLSILAPEDHRPA